jgi:DNA-binding FadR family transcriptional regulator
LEELSARTSPAEVLEVRLLIEPLVARLAATRATAPEIDQMKRLLEKGSKVRHPAVWEARDISLHRVVAQAAHNAFLLTIFDLFNDMRKQPTWGALRSASLTSERVKLYELHHRAFVGAISHRDPAEAEEAMRIHIQNVRDNLLGVSTTARKNPSLELSETGSHLQE